MPYLSLDLDLADTLRLEEVFHDLVDFYLVFGDVLLEFTDEVEEAEDGFLLYYEVIEIFCVDVLVGIYSEDLLQRKLIHLPDIRTDNLQVDIPFLQVFVPLLTTLSQILGNFSVFFCY